MEPAEKYVEYMLSQWGSAEKEGQERISYKYVKYRLSQRGSTEKQGQGRS